MKLSQFNSIIPVDAKWSLLYNALSDSFLCAAPADLERALGTLDPNDRLYSKLLDIGAVTGEECDKISAVMERIKEVDEDRRSVHIHINPTLQCNFSCWYCYEDHSGKSRMEDATIDAVIRMAERRISHPEVRHLQLSFFGGEPLLYFNDVAKRLISGIRTIAESKGIAMCVHFTTNAYLITDGMIGFFRDLDMSFQITLDGARESHDRVRFHGNRGSYDTIVSNVRKLLSAGKRVILRINYTVKNIGTVPEIFDTIAMWTDEEKEYLSVDLQQVWQDIGENGRDNEDIHYKVSGLMAFAKDHGFRCTSPSGVSGIGGSCYADRINHILINWNGDLFFCTARDFRRDARKGYLSEDGTEIWENDSFSRHMSVKFSKAACRKCRIGAVCLGGCRQKAAETADGDSCPFGYSDENIDNIIKGRFERLVIASRKPVMKY